MSRLLFNFSFYAAILLLQLVQRIAVASVVGRGLGREDVPMEHNIFTMIDDIANVYPEKTASSEDRTAIMTLLTAVAYWYPSLRQAIFVQDPGKSDVPLLLKDKTKNRQSLRTYICELKRAALGMPEGSNCENYYLPMIPPTAANSNSIKERPPQRGECSLGDVNEWLQGETTIKSGAMTLLFFISDSCSVCHEVTPKIDRMYRQYKHRGLNVIGIHSSPKGYTSTEEERRGIVESFRRDKISFPLADMTFKSGAHPVDDEGYRDYKAASRTPVLRSTIYRTLFGELEFATPLAFIVKNCQPLMEFPVDSYNILALDVSVNKAAEMMLWPDDLGKDFINSYDAPGGGEDFALPGGEDDDGEGGTDEDEDEEEEEEETRRMRRRRLSQDL